MGVARLWRERYYSKPFVQWSVRGGKALTGATAAWFACQKAPLGTTAGLALASAVLEGPGLFSKKGSEVPAYRFTCDSIMHGARLELMVALLCLYRQKRTELWSQAVDRLGEWVQGPQFLQLDGGVACTPCEWNRRLTLAIAADPTLSALSSSTAKLGVAFSGMLVVEMASLWPAYNVDRSR